MGQRQSGTPGAAATARYQPYTSSLTVDGGSNADRQSPGAARMPSSATATPDHHLRHLRPAVATGGRVRALSLGNFPGPSSSSTVAAGSQAASVGGAIGGAASSPDSDDDSGDDSGGLFGALAAMSSVPVPPSLTLYRDIKCPVCHKNVPPDLVEIHLVMCLTKPHIVYNEDILTEDKGECVICLDDLQQGDVIARLPCLCIYHKRCIDEWFVVNRTCPEHPGD